MHFDLLTTDIPQLLGTLTPETKPHWGRMDAQNVVEHLSLVMRISNGKNPLVGITLTPDRIERGRAFRSGPDPMPHDVRMPGIPADPPPHRFASIPAAIERLMKEINDFHAYWQQTPPTDLPWHPRFGPL